MHFINKNKIIIYNLIMSLKLVTNFKPSGDQPEAIKKLVQGVKNNVKNQVLLE